MESFKKNILTVLNIITLIGCFCSLAFGWGKMDTRINNVENQQAEMKAAIICIQTSIGDILFKMGNVEGKIDNLKK